MDNQGSFILFLNSMSTPKVGFIPSFFLGAKLHENAQNKI
jgi:hypothetical protein